MSLFSRIFSGVGNAIGGVARAALPVAAPLLGTAFGGPLGGVLGGALGGALGGTPKLGASRSALSASPAAAAFPGSWVTGGAGGLPQLPGLGVAELPPGSPGTAMYPSHAGGSSLTVYQGGRALAGARFTRQSAIEYFNATGRIPPGFHQTGPRSLYSVARNRRMNPLNPRALGRAMRRARSFAKYASKVVSFVKHGSHGAKFKHRRRRAA